MTDDQKGHCFKELLTYDVFRAQTVLENDITQALLNKMLTIDLSKEEVALEYARLRGALEILKDLKVKREALAQATRSRNSNS